MACIDVVVPAAVRMGEEGEKAPLVTGVKAHVEEGDEERARSARRLDGLIGAMVRYIESLLLCGQKINNIHTVV